MSSTIQSIALSAIPPVANPTRIAVVGCGYWGMNYVRIFNELLDARLVAICDERSDRLREVEPRFPGGANRAEPLLDPAVYHLRQAARMLATNAN